MSKTYVLESNKSIVKLTTKMMSDIEPPKIDETVLDKLYSALNVDSFPKTIITTVAGKNDDVEYLSDDVINEKSPNELRKMIYLWDK